MNPSIVRIDNQSTHAWLRSFELKENVRLGEQLKHWPVLLRQHIGFGSEPRATLKLHEGQEAPELIWNDYGLFGPTGPLPEVFMEKVLHSPNGGALIQFIDGLTQRLSHLHFRAWAASRPECDTHDRKNGFRSFIQSISGLSELSHPHFAWIKPLPQMLPGIAKNKLKLELILEQSPVQRIPNEMPCRLGSGRLGREILGSNLHIYTLPLRKFKVSVSPDSEQMFKELRDTDSAIRKKLNELIKVCISAPQKAEVHIQPVGHSVASKLGHIQLGRSLLSKGRFKNTFNIHEAI